MRINRLLWAALCAALLGLPVIAMAGPAPDADNDGIPDVLDNCSQLANAGALNCDTDQDGYGNACDADYDGDGDTDVTDFVNTFKPAFDQAQPFASVGDGDCDGDTDVTDFVNTFKPAFDQPQPFPAGPSGLPCAGSVPCQ
jgi:hypothetical protein